MNHPFWPPTANLQTLRERALIMQKIRDFFAKRQVLEVETPLLSQHSVTNAHIQSFKSLYQQADGKTQDYYLQTSPEYAMKRLLAAGSGALYQVCKSFRNGDCSEIHNPEFTMLEWYRPGFNLEQLMDEMDELLQLILKTAPADRLSYADLFKQHLDIDPFASPVAELKKLAEQKGIFVAGNIDHFDKDTWLQLLMGHLIEPHLGPEKPVFIYDFPASQAALARLKPENSELAARFEVYIHGMELANGFYELSDAKEQRQRFEKDQQQRKELGYTPMRIDERLLAALEEGLPDCSGVALGVDRLMMAVFKTQKIKDVISFDWERA